MKVYGFILYSLMIMYKFDDQVSSQPLAEGKYLSKTVGGNQVLLFSITKSRITFVFHIEAITGYKPKLPPPLPIASKFYKILIPLRNSRLPFF